LMVWTALARILPMKEAWQIGAVEYLSKESRKWARLRLT
jgi:hypothetical protein